MKKYFLDRFAFFVSILSSPYLTIAAFGLWNISVYSPDFNDFLHRGALFLVFIIILPLLYVVFAMKAGAITDLHVTFRDQRGGPFIVALLGVMLLGELYHLQDTPRAIEVMTVAVAVSGVVFFVISKYWKISLHTSSLAGSIAATALLIDEKAWWLLLFVPVVIWARVYRRRHNMLQAVISFMIILGITVAVCQYFGVGPGVF